tara:strand:+ start:728 stop:2107 length:1380 start_codon:yes stop_codon:yes gene_type:complete
MSDKAIFWYLSIYDEVNENSIATIKHFGIKNVIYFINDDICEITLKKRRYISYLIKQRLRFICNKYNLNLFQIPLFKEYNHEDFSEYIENASNFFLSLYRDEKILSTKRVKNQIKKMSELALSVNKSAENFLKDSSYKEIYLFNNRMPTGYAVSKACKTLKIAFITFDLLALTRLHFAKNTELLSPKNFNIEITKELKNIPPERIKEVGKKFIEYKRNSKFVAFKIYTNKQIKNYIPLNLKKKYICFFTSSEDEAKFYGENTNFKVINQYLFIKNVMEYLVNEDLQIVVRVHPNQAGMGLEKDLINLSKNSKEKLILILGNSQFDTYALMEKSITNISFGSSTGVESLLMGKISYLCGRSFYEDVIKIPKFFDEKTLANSIIFKTFKKVEDDQLLSASKWSTYLSGEFAPKDITFSNIKLKFNYPILVIFLLKIFWIERILTYPIVFIIRLIKIKLKNQ